MSDNNISQPKGFAMIFRYGENRYTSVENWQSIAGIRPEEAWIFGAPCSQHEFEIYRIAIPQTAWIENKKKIHFIPSDTEFARISKGTKKHKRSPSIIISCLIRAGKSYRQWEELMRKKD